MFDITLLMCASFNHKLAREDSDNIIFVCERTILGLIIRGLLHKETLLNA